MEDWELSYVRDILGPSFCQGSQGRDELMEDGIRYGGPVYTTKIDLRAVERELTIAEDALLLAYRVFTWRNGWGHSAITREIEQISKGLDAVLNIKQAFGFRTVAEPIEKRQIAQTTVQTYEEYSREREKEMEWEKERNREQFVDAIKSLIRLGEVLEEKKDE